MIKKKTNNTEQEKQGVIYSENIQIPIKTGKNNNALIVGAKDAEMQKRFIEPNLFQANDSYVVAGIPEISVLRMQDKMIENGCNIQILDLDGYMSTVQYDPLKHIDKHCHTEEDAKKIVDCIINNTLDNSHLDSLELQLEKILLTSLILYLVEIADKNVCNLNTVLWMLKLAYILPARPSQYTYYCSNGFDVNNHLDELFNGQREIVQTICYGTNQKHLNYEDINSNNDSVNLRSPSPDVDGVSDSPYTSIDEESKLQDLLCDSLCLRQYQLFKCSDIKTQKKVITDAIMRFSLFTDIYKYEKGKISYQKSNINDELDIQSLRQPKSCLFIAYSKASKATKVLTAILISQIYDSLTRESYESHQKNHVKIIVDGVNDACFIPELKCKLASCQYFNMSFDVLLPSITIAEAIYEDWNYISQAFNVYVCFDAIDEYTAEYFTQRIKNNMKNKYAFQKNKYAVACIQKILDKNEIMIMSDYDCLIIINKIGQFTDMKKR